MAASRTFLQLKDAVKIRGGYENSVDIDDDVLEDVVNSSVKELYDLLVGKWADYYTVLSSDMTAIGTVTGTGDELTAAAGGVITLQDTVTEFDPIYIGLRVTISDASETVNNGTFRITTNPASDSITFLNSKGEGEISSFAWTITATDTFALPSDFYKLRKVELKVGERWRRLYPHDLETTHRYTATGERRYRYRLQAGNIVLSPDPGSTEETIRIYYIPACPTLVEDGDTFDGINGYEELVINIALRRCKGDREDLDTTSIEREIARLSGRVRESSDGRDAEPFYLDPHGPPMDGDDLSDDDWLA